MKKIDAIATHSLQTGFLTEGQSRTINRLLSAGIHDAADLEALDRLLLALVSSAVVSVEEEPVLAMAA